MSINQGINELEIDNMVDGVVKEENDIIVEETLDINEEILFSQLTKKYYDNEVGFMLQLIDDVQESNESSPMPSKITISTQSANCNIIIPEINFMDMALLFSREITMHIKKKSVIKKYKKSSKIIEEEYISLEHEIHGVEHKNVYSGFLKKKRNFYKKQFDNQISILIGEKGKGKINLKLFKNGSIILTGCKEENVVDGIKAIECLKRKIYEYRKILLKNKMIANKKFTMEKQTVKEKEKSGTKMVESLVYDEIMDSMKIHDMKITLINCGFSLNYKLDRLMLFKVLREDYKLFVSYNPLKYAGVKISYMLNSKNKNKDGICYCETKCKVKDKKRGKEDCLAVTIPIFASGEVVITGARTMDQIYEAYHFINRVMKYNFRRVIRNNLYEELIGYRKRKKLLSKSL